MIRFPKRKKWGRMVDGGCGGVYPRERASEVDLSFPGVATPQLS